MSEYQEKVTTSQNAGTDEAGNQIQQETKKVKTSSSANSRTVATNLVWFIVGLIEISVALRFVLKLFGANPNNGFVDFVYTFTGYLTAPFDNIFNVAKVTSGSVHSVFEPSIIVAAIVYGLIGWGIVTLLNITQKTD